MKCHESIQVHFSAKDYGYSSYPCHLDAWHEGPCEVSLNFGELDHLATHKYDRTEVIHAPVAYSKCTSRGIRPLCHPKKMGIYQVNRYGCYPDMLLAQDLCEECAINVRNTLNETA